MVQSRQVELGRQAIATKVPDTLRANERIDVEGIEGKFSAFAAVIRKEFSGVRKIKNKVATKVTNSYDGSLSAAYEEAVKDLDDFVKSIKTGIVSGATAGAVVGALVTGNLETMLLATGLGAVAGMVGGGFKHIIWWDMLGHTGNQGKSSVTEPLFST